MSARRAVSNEPPLERAALVEPGHARHPPARSRHRARRTRRTGARGRRRGRAARPCRSAPTPDPATLIGRGKAEALALACDEADADSRHRRQRADARAGAQPRRSSSAAASSIAPQLILDIFARRARTREGQLQVELAQLAVPAAAAGRIEHGALAARRRHRHARPWRNEARDRSPPHPASHRRAEARDRRRRPPPRLSARAAPAHRRADRRARRLHERRQDHAVQPADGRDRARRPTRSSSRSIRSCAACRLPDARQMLLSDTVGFIDRLPHQLVAAFHATLEEVVGGRPAAARHRRRRRRIAIAGSPPCGRVLAEVGAAAVPVLEVFNKIDLRRRRRARRGFEARIRTRCCISATPRHGPRPTRSTSWRRDWPWTPSGCGSSSTQAARPIAGWSPTSTGTRASSATWREDARVDRGGRAATARRPLPPREGAGMTGRAFAPACCWRSPWPSAIGACASKHAPAPPVAVRARLSAVSDARRSGRAARRRRSVARSAVARVATCCRPAISAAPSATSPRCSRRTPAFYPAETGLGFALLADEAVQAGGRALHGRRSRRTIATCRRWQGQAEARAGAGRRRRGDRRARAHPGARSEAARRRGAVSDLLRFRQVQSLIEAGRRARAGRPPRRGARRRSSGR